VKVEKENYRNMKMSIITCFGDRTCGPFLALSDKENSVSRTDNFANVFNSVTYSPVLSYHCILNYFLTMSVGFHFNLTLGLKPEVGGIKIVSHCLKTIHFPSLVAHSHFDFLKTAVVTSTCIARSHNQVTCITRIACRPHMSTMQTCYITVALLA